MLIKVTEKDKEAYQVDLDQVWVWTRIERELNLTIQEANNLIVERGSTHTITYAIWVAAEIAAPYEVWVKSLTNFEVVSDSPKATKKTRLVTES